MFSSCSLQEFTDELASSSPAPGGGSVAGLAASLGSALSSMVFNLTIGKKSYNEQNDEVKELINTQLKENEIARNEFLSLMDKDTEEFMKLMTAFKLPKESEEEKNIRSIKIQEGYMGAIEVPMTLAQKAYKIFDYIDTACKYGNKNAISDAGVGALLIQSAIEAAVLNVKINLSSIKNEDLKVKINKQCEELIMNSIERKGKILSIVYKEIG